MSTQSIDLNELLGLPPGTEHSPIDPEVWKDFVEDYRNTIPPQIKYWNRCRALSEHPNGLFPPMG